MGTGYVELALVALRLSDITNRHTHAHTHIIWHKLFNSSNKVCYRQFQFIQRHDYAFSIQCCCCCWMLCLPLAHLLTLFRSIPFGFTSTIIFAHQFELLVFFADIHTQHFGFGKLNLIPLKMHYHSFQALQQQQQQQQK